MEISIRRKENERSHLPIDVVSAAKVKLSSVLVNQAPYRGLSIEEEAKYLPSVIGISASDPEFTKAAWAFWAELSISIPVDGYTFNIALNEDGEPINVSEWVKYKWAVNHPLVARSEHEMRSNYAKRFYIHNYEEDVKRRASDVKLKRRAYIKFAEISQKKDVMKRVIRVLGHKNPENMSEEQMETFISDIIERSPSEFYAVASDKDLAIKDLLVNLVSSEVIRKVGHTYFYMDDIIGESQSEAMAFLKSKKNSATVVEMKAKLNEMVV